MSAAAAPALGEHDALRLERCVAAGGVAVFPADTVYGLRCDPCDERAAARLYALKQRRPDRPAAVMFFSLELALAALGDLGERERAAARALLPGPVTLLLCNRARRYLPACGPHAGTLGVRVPRLDGPLRALERVSIPLMQSSANLSGGADPRSLRDVPSSVRDGADEVLDAGELPGVASTVVDLSDYERSGEFRIVRAGAMAGDEVRRLLAC